MRNLAFLASICILSLTAGAQSIYIKPFTGYGMAVQDQLFCSTSSDYFENIDTNYSTNSHEALNYSFGKGLKFGIAIGTAISNTISFELVAGYSKGKSSEFVLHNNGKYDYYGQIYTVEFTDKYKYISKSFQITPGLVLKRDIRKSTGYLKLGAIIGYTQITENFTSSLYNSIPSYYPFESWSHVMRYKWTPSLGFSSAIGFDYKLIDDVYAFAEIQYNSMYCAPKKAEITEYKYRDQDKLSSLAYNERNFEYVDAYTDADNNDPSASGKRLIQKYSFSNISIIAGLRIDFNFKKAPDKK
jgi:hypothetical protein